MELVKIFDFVKPEMNCDTEANLALEKINEFRKGNIDKKFWKVIPLKYFIEIRKLHYIHTTQCCLKLNIQRGYLCDSCYLYLIPQSALTVLCCLRLENTRLNHPV